MIFKKTESLRYIFVLLFGHPLLFFNGSQEPLVLQKYKLKIELNYVVCYRVVFVKNAYFPLHPLDLEISQLQAVTQGISVLDEDYNRFLAQWNSEYPELEIKKINESQELIPEF